MKCFVTRQLPKPAMERLAQHFELKVNPHDRVLAKAEILKGVQWCDILLCLLTDPIDAEIIQANPNLKGIVNYAVGYNNIDVATATSCGIPVTNTPGVLTQTTADLAWALLFSVARRTVESDAFTRQCSFAGWAPQLFLGGDVFGKTLGIVGAGRIGTAVALRSRGFEMPVLYVDQAPNETLETRLNARKVSLDELLQHADFVSLHVPLLPDTRHLIGAEQLAMMKPTAYLINTARGPVVDEAALVAALQNGSIAGAGLDVYEAEPELQPGLAQLPNVVLTPHIASASIETRTRMGMICAENAQAIAAGAQPPQIVNPQIYHQRD